MVSWALLALKFDLPDAFGPIRRLDLMTAIVGYPQRPHWMEFSGEEVHIWNGCKQGAPGSPTFWRWTER